MNPTILASAAPSVRLALQGPGKVDAVLSMGAITAPGGHPEPLYVNVLGPRIYPNIQPAAFLGDAFHYVNSVSDIAPVLDRLQSQHAEFVKIMVLNSEEYAQRQDSAAHRAFSGLNPALVQPIVAEAHRRGLRVVAHIETAADFRVIVAAGVDEAAHMPGYYGAAGPLDRYTITSADAGAAGRAHMVVVATASLAAVNNRDQPARLAEVQGMQRTNLKLLKAAGVPLLIGTDGGPADALREAQYLIGLGVFTPREAIAALSEITPAWIFPGRRIGKLAIGYEASFLVLRGDPTMDFSQSSTIVRRVKQGFEMIPPATPPTLAVTHVAVIGMTDETIRPNQTILIAGNRILDIGPKLKLPPGLQVVDASGRFAIPGLWDMHVHVLVQPTEAAREAMLLSLLRGGIMGVRDMGSMMAQLQEFNAARDAKSGPWPEVIAAGPVINGAATPWSRPIEAHASTPEDGRRLVLEQIAAGSAFIKPYGGLDPATYEAVAEATHSKGLALAGHLPMSVTLQSAVAAGQRSIEHMEVHLSKSCGALAATASDIWITAYARAGLAGRDANELSLRASRHPAQCRALLAQLARSSIWWTPTLVLDFADGSYDDENFRRYAPPDGVAACRTMGTDIAKVPVSLRMRALQAELDDVRELRLAGVHLLAGTDMPGPCTAPVDSLQRELELFVRTGASPYQALRTATVEPADYLGRADAGRLVPGNVADLVILNRNPLKDVGALRSVAAVIKGGRVVSKD
jgi:imidazolonepropionase-like amidohydrolase